MDELNPRVPDILANVNSQAPMEIAPGNMERTNEVLNLLIDEALKRLVDAKQLKKMSISDILFHMEKLMMSIKKNNVFVQKNTQVNIGRMNERIEQLHNNPARRKLLRQQIQP